MFPYCPCVLTRLGPRTQRAGSAPTTDLSHPPSGPVVLARLETRSQTCEGADRAGGALGGHRGGGTLAKTEIIEGVARKGP